MALKFSQNELDQMGSVTHVVPEKEYSQGDYTAMFETFNTAGILNRRGELEKQAVNTSQFEGVEFNRDNLRANLAKRGIDPSIVNNVMVSPVDNWEEAEQRLGYLLHRKEASEQVQSEFSTSQQLLVGGAMSLFDIDMIVTGPTYKLGQAIAKSSSLATRVGNKLDNVAEVATEAPSKVRQITAGVATGGVIGAEIAVGMEMASGVYEEDSVTNAALLGMALNGTLSAFAAKAPVPRYVDEAKTILDKEAAKVEKLANAQQELADINKVIDEVQATQKAQKTATKELPVSQKQDVGRAKVDNRQQKINLKSIKDRAWQLVGSAKKDLKAAESNLNALNKVFKESGKKVTKAEEVNKAASIQEGIKKAFLKEATPIKGQVTKLTNQLAKLEGKVDTASLTKAAAITSKLALSEKKLRVLEAKVTRADTRLSKLEVTTKADLDNLKNTSKGQEIEINNRQHDRNDLKTKLERETSEHKAAKESFEGQRIAPREGQVVTGSATQKLEAKLAKYEADLSPEGIQALMSKQKTLENDIGKMSSDNFDIKELYGVRGEKQNAVAKLNRELEEVNMLQDFTKSATFKKLPEWMQKLVISPVEKLMASNNQAVVAFASMLHSGTMHHGLINNMNAWNIRLELDTEVNRMHKAIINSYKNAVQDGYKGKFASFEMEAASHAYQVTGKMQRQMFSGIDGTIVGLERMELAKAKVGAVTREHTSGNKHIDKAVDDYLDYYEAIHVRGEKLGMDAFKGSIGKGYIKRVYSTSKISAMGEEKAIDHLVEAQKAFAIDTNSLVTPDIMLEFRAKATTAITASMQREYKMNMVTKPLGTPRQSTTSSLKQRGIDAYDDDLRFLLDDDVIGTSQVYALNTHGRLALKERLGVDNNEQIEALISSATLGATPKEMDNLRVIIETINGTREVSRTPFDPFTRAVKALGTYSSAMHTMGFVVPTVTETATVAAQFGWGRTIERLVGNTKEVYSIYKNGTPSEKNTIELSISYGDANFATKANRYDGTENIDSVGRWQAGGDKLVRMEAVYGGLLPMTDVLRMTTASLAVDFIARMSVSKNISKTDRMRLQDMGFDLEHLSHVRDTLNVDSNGRILNMDRKTWGALDRSLTLGIQNMVERTILNPNGATLPKFMTNVNEGQFIPRVMMKFMRFPFESYERLLGRGLQEADSKQLAGLGGNIGMWSLLLLTKDAIKDEEDQEFSGKDGMQALMMRSFLMNSFTSLPLAAVDTVSGALTGENLTNEYRYRIGGVIQSDLESAQRGDLRYSIPFTNINIGDGVAHALGTIAGLEELERDD